MVALRAWRKPLSLHGVETALRGEVAYPMFANAGFLGALIVGPKRSMESYAQGESAAVEQLVQSVATALELMSAKEDGTKITQTLLRLSDEISELRRALSPERGVA